MPNSMTGFGRAEASSGGVRVVAESRSVNNRYLNIRTRVPARFARMEPSLEEEVRRVVGRGTVDLTLRVRGRAAGERPTIDTGLAKAWLASIRDVAAETGVSADIGIEVLLTLPGVVELTDDEELTDVESKLLVKVARSALKELAAMRGSEGDRLADELSKILGRVDKLVVAIEKRSAKVPSALKDRYLLRIRTLLDQEIAIDPGHLEREVAILADRCDITEELARLKSHTVEFRSTLKKKGPIGRSLDFLVQELGREANTVASKNQDVEIGRKVIELRSDIDRLREQVQNLE